MSTNTCPLCALPSECTFKWIKKVCKTMFSISKLYLDHFMKIWRHGMQDHAGTSEFQYIICVMCYILISVRWWYKLSFQAKQRMKLLKVLFLQWIGGLVYLVYGWKEFMSIPQVMPLTYTKQSNNKDLAVNQHLTNDNIINTIMEYIKYIPLYAYSVAEKSLYQSLQ
jgi:hypothetical protein